MAPSCLNESSRSHAYHLSGSEGGSQQYTAPESANCTTDETLLSLNANSNSVVMYTSWLRFTIS